MRSRDEVVDEAQRLISEEFSRRVNEAGLRLPWKCRHNYKHPLDPRKTDEFGDPNPNFNKIKLPIYPVKEDEYPNHMIGLCLHGYNGKVDDNWRWDRVCEEASVSRSCPDFTSIESRESVLDKFVAELNDPAWVAMAMPRLAAIMWVLESMPPIRPTWWQRLKLWVKGVKTEAIRVSVAGDDDAGPYLDIDPKP